MSKIFAYEGWGPGKLAYLLGCSVEFLYPDMEDKAHQWTKSRKRELVLPRAINLGCRKKYIPAEFASPEKCFNFNSQFTGSKIQVFRKFDEVGIPHPRLFRLETLLAGKGPNKFLGRQNRSRSGRGIELYDRSTWKKGVFGGTKGAPKEGDHDFYVEFLECKSEHRVHVFQGQAIMELNKVIPDPTNFIHTKEQGSTLEVGKIEHPDRFKIIDYAIQAVNVCGLDFGAVDIFIDRKGRIFILEVNSDPGLPGIVGYVYAEKFRQYFGLDQPLESYVSPHGENVEVDPKFFYKLTPKLIKRQEKLAKKVAEQVS